MGVEVELISAGDGNTFPNKGDTVVMHYTGTLANGNKFDSSRDRGQPFKTKIGVGQVIKGVDLGSDHSLAERGKQQLIHRGWDEGVPKMSKGQKAILHISADYGYGAAGAGGVIPPNADLNFEVELIDIIRAPGQQKS